MKLRITLAKALIMIFALSSAAFAGNITLQGAIQKYKAGNYTGCIQDLETYTRNDQSNALAYYYLAIANVQAGRKENAIQAYDRVLALRPNETLLDYATKGKVCLEEPQFCYKSNTMKEEDTELDKFIKDKNQFVYKEAQKEETKKNLDTLKNRINSEEEINHTEFEEYERSSNKENKNVKQAKMPTNDEVVAAIKILNQAGLGSIITQQPAQQPPQQTEQQKQMLQAMAAIQQNPYGNISAMFGGNNNNNNNSASQLMNMLPLIMAQGGQNGQNAMSPDVIQAMMMNAMMPDLNFNTSDNNR